MTIGMIAASLGLGIAVQIIANNNIVVARMIVQYGEQ